MMAMLMVWQQRFPRVFKNHELMLSQLSSEQQDELSELLRLIDQSVKGLLNEKIISGILSHMPCLSEFKKSIKHLMKHSLMLSEYVELLVSNSHPIDCAELIVRASDSGVKPDKINHYLTGDIFFDGLSDAMTLFDRRQYGYSEENLKSLGILSSVLGNPLSRVIFDARLRCFSDYEMPSDPVSSQSADEIIQRVTSLENQEARVKEFFNYFTDYRPLPPSQDYIVDINVHDLIVSKLESYCHEKINFADTFHALSQVKQMIKTLSEAGGNQDIFNAIKYDVASIIESEDLCSMRNYDDLMQAVWGELNKPQIEMRDLSDDIDEREKWLKNNSISLGRTSVLAQCDAVSRHNQVVQLNDNVINHYVFKQH